MSKENDSTFRDFTFVVTEYKQTEILARGRSASEAAKLAGIIYADSESRSLCSSDTTRTVQLTLASNPYVDADICKGLEPNEFETEFQEGYTGEVEKEFLEGYGETNED